MHKVPALEVIIMGQCALLAFLLLLRTCS